MGPIRERETCSNGFAERGRRIDDSNGNDLVEVKSGDVLDDTDLRAALTQLPTLAENSGALGAELCSGSFLPCGCSHTGNSVGGGGARVPSGALCSVHACGTSTPSKLAAFRAPMTTRTN